MITEVNLRDIPTGRGRRAGRARLDMLEFIRSDMSACKVDWSPYKSYHVACRAYYNARKGRPEITVSCKENEIYLIKKGEL